MSGRPGRYFPVDGMPYRAFGYVKVVTGLQIDPELWRCPEVACQSQRRIGGDGAASMHDLVQPRARYLDVPGKPIDAESHRFQELITQDCSGMHRMQPSSRSDVREINPEPVRFFSVNGHVRCGSRSSSTISTSPASPSRQGETDAPLRVDANAMLPKPVATKDHRPSMRSAVSIAINLARARCWICVRNP